jgi:hypothetical protein
MKTFDKFKGLTLWNKVYFIVILILTILLYSGALMLGITGAFSNEKDANTQQPIPQTKKFFIAAIMFIFAGICTWWANAIYTDPKNQKKCNVAMWSTTSIIMPTSFSESVSNIASICDAQIYAQYSDSDAVAFVLKKYSDTDYGYMSITDKGYKITETEYSDDYVIYYTKDAGINVSSSPIVLLHGEHVQMEFRQVRL